MTKSLQFHLKAGSRLFVNGAVLKVDRKVAVEFLNDVNFLLEHHVMQPDQATTPLKQIYYVIQLMMMERDSTEEHRANLEKTLQDMAETYENTTVREGLLEVRQLMAKEGYFHALKVLRGLFSEEQSKQPDERSVRKPQYELAAVEAGE